MSSLSLAIFVLGVGLEAALLARALATGTLQKHAIFYSYIGYVFVCELIAVFTLYVFPQNHPTVYWFYLLGRTLAEFGVLIAVSDSVFKPYPPIRFLGRLIVGATCVAFIAFFGISLHWNPQPSRIVFLNLEKISALTKGVAIAGLLASARSYRIPMRRNAGGILMGLAAYQAIALANFAAAAEFGRTIYAGIMTWLHPLAYGICLTIWTFALWRPDAVVQRHREAVPMPGLATPRPMFQLRRFSTYVTRLLWK